MKCIGTVLSRVVESRAPGLIKFDNRDAFGLIIYKSDFEVVLC